MRPHCVCLQNNNILIKILLEIFLGIFLYYFFTRNYGFRFLLNFFFSWPFVTYLFTKYRVHVTSEPICMLIHRLENSCEFFGCPRTWTVSLNERRVACQDVIKTWVFLIRSNYQCCFTSRLSICGISTNVKLFGGDVFPAWVLFEIHSGLKFSIEKMICFEGNFFSEKYSSRFVALLFIFIRVFYIIVYHVVKILSTFGMRRSSRLENIIKWIFKRVIIDFGSNFYD